MADLSYTGASFKKRLKPGPGALILTKEHNFISYLFHPEQRLASEMWPAQSESQRTQRTWQILYVWIYNRIIIHPVPELHACQGSRLSNSGPGDYSPRVIWLGNGSRLLLLRNTSKSSSICATASTSHA